MSELNIASKEWVIRQYDHEVQGGSVIKPLTGIANDGPSDAGVVRPLLTAWQASRLEWHQPVLRGHRYLSHDGLRHRRSNKKHYCSRRQLKQIALLDNFCWCDPVRSEKTPDGEYKLAQLVRACRALYDVTTAYRIPCISGKDSMKNDYKQGRKGQSSDPIPRPSCFPQLDSSPTCASA
jgi:phosphoribosylformylglycinamidine synthase